jgi:outer membrane protein TolC
MRTSLILIHLLALLLSPELVNSQDSTQVFTLDDLYQSMWLFHPIVKQAQLLPEQAKEEIKMARGSGFDPKFSSNWEDKTLKGNDYYHVWQNSLKIPTWIGADIKVGYDEGFGNYVNNQNYTSSQGMSYVGISVPVGQGLFIDQRRATLRQAQLFQQISEAEKIKLINKIFFEAAKDYWEWYFKYYRAKNLELGMNLAKTRYEFVKKKIEFGDEAPIDSTEALILLQIRTVAYNQTLMELNNAVLQLSNHTWGKNEQPLELEINSQPELFLLPLNIINTENLSALLADAAKNHPEIQKFNLKIKQLDVERRLANETFKPIINLNYSLLSANRFSKFSLDKNYLQDNYKLGFDMSMPILFRKERGKLNLTKAKIKQTEFERNFANRQISNDINQYFNELKNLEQVIEIQKNLIRNYTILRDGELEKFNNGESSLFLVNSRETNLIETRIKLAEMEAKFQKAKAGLYWSAGVLGNR